MSLIPLGTAVALLVSDPFANPISLNTQKPCFLFSLTSTTLPSISKSLCTQSPQSSQKSPSKVGHYNGRQYHNFDRITIGAPTHMCRHQDETEVLSHIFPVHNFSFLKSPASSPPRLVSEHDIKRFLHQVALRRFAITLDNAMILLNNGD